MSPGLTARPERDVAVAVARDGGAGLRERHRRDELGPQTRVEHGSHLEQRGAVRRPERQVVLASRHERRVQRVELGPRHRLARSLGNAMQQR